MSNFICEGNQHALGGQTQDTISLPVSIENLPDQVEIESNILLRKSKFHVSLVCIGRLIKKYNIAIPDFVEKVVKDFCEYTKSNRVELIKYKDEFKFVEDGERKSVVVMCDTSNLEKFFDLLNEKYGLALENQPTHVSLFTLQQDKAIFLVDSKDLEALAKVIPTPIDVRLNQ